MGKWHKSGGKGLILDRAYDKAVKGIRLAELEESVLRDAIRYSAKKAKLLREPYRKAVRERFGWDTPEGEAQWKVIVNKILNPGTQK
jgi:hypothetical protein